MVAALSLDADSTIVRCILPVGVLLLALVGDAVAQSTIRGRVVSSSAPVAGANVFLIETLDGAVTDSSGDFTFTTLHAGAALLVIKAAGFGEVRRRLELPLAAPVSVTLKKGAHALAPTSVVASRYAAADERGATLTTLDVVATPGTNADVLRGIQTLPGVQSVDEGTGLYVRGGDYMETHVLVNDAVLHTAFTFESPNGTFVGTVDPFLLDGIFFSSGGFGARHGNALSGIAALNTLGRPRRSAITVGAGLAALSLSAAHTVNDALGVRVAANQFDTDLLFRVNGSTVDYDTPPRGHDRSASVIWTYRPTGELKVFAIDQRTSLASTLEDASYSGAYAMATSGHLGVVNWRDVVGAWSPSLRLSDTRMQREQDYGAFRLETGQRFSGASAQLDYAASGALTLRSGIEWERNWSRLDGSLPDFGYDRDPAARVTVVGSTLDADRIAAFTELDLLAGARTRLVAGLRSDRSQLTRHVTFDPRLSAAITLVRGIVLTTAWGVYHQVPDPIFYDDSIGDPALPSMRATHAIVGIQAGGAAGAPMLRLELFEKRYRDLAQVTRDYDIARGGFGSARGADLFASGTLLRRTRWRVSLSSIAAKRTEPATGILARAPFDVTNSITAVVNHSITPAWHIGVTHRHATGRPFTPVVDATFDAAENVWVPEYGAPMSERLPAFRRVDVGLTRLQRIGATSAVFYASASNVFDRENVFTYRYSPDYSSRIPVRSIFKRSFYVGASLTTQ